jgi:hypothetical protein
MDAQSALSYHGCYSRLSAAPAGKRASYSLLHRTQLDGRDRRSIDRYGRPMPRRNVFDALEPAQEPRWYIVRKYARGPGGIPAIASWMRFEAYICRRHAQSH